MGFRRKKQVNTEVILSEGVVMKQPLQMETSSWLRNCMVKSLLVFGVIFGSLGCFLSAFGIEYYVLPVAVILFAMALLFTTIYYRGWIMDVVYIIFAVIFFFLVRGFQPLINGGYYLIINKILETVENYFDLPGMQYYEVGNINEPLAASMIVVFIGTVMMIVANVIISRTMNVWFLLFMTGFLWIIPMYFRLESDAVYVILLIAGYLAVWSIRSSGAYGMERKYRSYRWKDRKGKPLRVKYVQDAATMLETMGLMLVVVLFLYGVTALVGDRDTFQDRYRQNPYKEETEDMVQMMSTRGFSIFDRYQATGGISSGQLGGVGSVSPDYQTDLIVTFAPYSYEPVYLKAYTGVDYVSAESRWKNTDQWQTVSTVVEDQSSAQPDTDAALLKNCWEESGSGAEAKMLIQNLDADANYPYVPYYTDVQKPEQTNSSTGAQEDSEQARNNQSLRIQDGYILRGTIPRGTTAEYQYYPDLNAETTGKEGTPDGSSQTVEEDVGKQAQAMYMQVPEECREAVAKASQEAGITETDTQEEIIEKVKTYFETEFLYTTRPGKTPKDTDYISWFLDKKKGYCAHFASAATMIYRYNGIPARYIEGYVMTYEDVMGGELNEDEIYEDFYQGESSLGKTGVVTVEITDARAHAWVEVFDPDFGWKPEEVTVAAIDPDETLDSFWEVFGSENGTGTQDGDNNGFQLQLLDWNLDDVSGVWIALIIVLALLAGIALGRRIYAKRKEYQTWHTEDPNENVLAYYQLISGRLRKKDAEYNRQPTYRRQLEYIRAYLTDTKWEALIDPMERAGYSRDGLTEDECRQVMMLLSELDRMVKKWKHLKK